MSDPLRKQIDEPEAEQIDQECPAEQIDEPDPTPSASATPEQEIPPNCRNRLTQTHKKRGTRSVRTQTVVAGTATSSPAKRLLECPSFTEAQAVGEVTAVPSLAGFCNSCNRNGIIESSSSISSVKDSKPEATRAVQHLKVLHYPRSVQRLECETISEIARGQRGANCNCIRYACGQSWT